MFTKAYKGKLEGNSKMVIFFFIVSIFYDIFVFNLALGGFYISLLMTDVKKKLLGKPSNPTRFSSNVKGLHQMLKTKTSEK